MEETRSSTPLVVVGIAALAATTYLRLRHRRNGAKPESVAPPFPRVLEESLAANSECKWIRLKKIAYADDAGNVREWEKVERATRREGVDFDGVLISAKIVGGERDGCVPFVSQFRPPIGRKTLELPAGLVDKGETVEQAALRELYEETGLIGKVISVSPVLYLDPGMSGSAMRVAFVEVDGTDIRNQNPVQQLDVGEFCQVIYLKHPTMASINKIGKDLAIESNVYQCCLMD